jgi:hypothetical protein
MKSVWYRVSYQNIKIYMLKTVQEPFKKCLKKRLKNQNKNLIRT